ncbi:hypothetical protein ASF74_14715 [Arthrobacter sp. Leaf145]|nr:hypothetical protein ASF74_14715 [Arthrobacter sp. Leaf145]
MTVPSEAIEAARKAAHEWGEEGEVPEDEFLRTILEAAAPSLKAQALEDAVIDFGVKSVFLTSAQETMATWMRERAAELRL